MRPTLEMRHLIDRNSCQRITRAQFHWNGTITANRFSMNIYFFFFIVKVELEILLSNRIMWQFAIGNKSRKKIAILGRTRHTSISMLHETWRTNHSHFSPNHRFFPLFQNKTAEKRISPASAAAVLWMHRIVKFWARIGKIWHHLRIDRCYTAAERENLRFRWQMRVAVAYENYKFTKAAKHTAKQFHKSAFSESISCDIDSHAR